MFYFRDMEQQLISVLRQLFKRDLIRLKKEIESYNEESALWKVDGTISNSGGNLCLHLIGNLNAFIASVYADTGYIRDREFEFAGKNVPREKLIIDINQTILVVDKGLQNISGEQLLEEYPILVFKERTTTLYMITHLSTHLNYHLGQINYHRRCLDTSDINNT